MPSDEAAKVRAHYVNEAGKGQLVEELLAERANTAAYGGDTAGADKRLSELGWPFHREEAAEKRAKAAEDAGEDEERPARARPPQGRTAPPRASG